MAERIINVTVSTAKPQRVTVNSNQVKNEITATGDLGLYYSKLSKNWAIGEGLVQGEDYSSKYYAKISKESAENSKNYATTAEELIDGFAEVVNNETQKAKVEISDTKTSSLTDIEHKKIEAIDSIEAATTLGESSLSDLHKQYADDMNAILVKTEEVAEEAKETLVNKADKATTLAGYGITDGLNKSQISNCLLEVPQRIKYDLTDGVLTIKKGSQVVVPYGTTNENFTKVGSPTIVDGVASGFSNNNCLELPATFNPSNKPWKIVIKATHGELGSNNYRALLGSSTRQSDFQGIALAITKEGTLRCWFSSTGTGWDIGSITSKKVYNENQTYYFKLEFTGTKYELSSSDDGKNWDIHGALVSSTPIISAQQRLSIGDNKYSYGNYWTGSIDLNKFSITVDGQVVYRPYLQKGDRFLNDNFKVTDTQYDDGKFFVWAELQSDITGSGGGYSSVATRFAYINISADGIGIFQNASSGTSTSSTGNLIHYRTDTNIMEQFSGGVLSQQVCSLPIMRITNSADYLYASIDQVFNGIGYIGSTVWCDKGVKGLIPNGRNEDGTLNNYEFTLPNILTSTLTGTTRDMVAIVYNGGESYTLYRGFYKDYAYNAEENVNMNIQTHPKWDILPIGTTEGDITSFQPKQPFHAVDYQEFTNSRPYAYVTYLYKSGQTWYKLWSDGFIEQGGMVTPTNTSWTAVTLPKAYKSNNYWAGATQAGASDDMGVVKVGNSSKNTTTKIYVKAGVANTGVFWEAKGY